MACPQPCLWLVALCICCVGCEAPNTNGEQALASSLRTEPQSATTLPRSGGYAHSRFGGGDVVVGERFAAVAYGRWASKQRIHVYRVTDDGWIFDQALDPPSGCRFFGELALTGSTLATLCLDEALIYDRSNRGWSIATRISLSPGNAIDVALAPDLLAVSAYVATAEGERSIVRLYGRGEGGWELVDQEERTGWWGAPLAFSEDHLAVGAAGPYATSPPLVFVYNRSGTELRLESVVEAGDVGYGMYGLDIDGDTFAVGLRDDSALVSPNTVEIYEHRGDSLWPRVAEFEATGGLHHEGPVVSVAGDRLAVGSVDSVHLYQRAPTGWSLAADAVPFEPEGSDLRNNVALTATTLAVSAPGSSVDEYEAGATFVYSAAGDRFEPRGHVGPTETRPMDSARFGGAIAMSGTWAAVSARGASVQYLSQGVVYMYRRQETGWEEIARLHSDDTGKGATFGSAVALEDAELIVGAPGGLAGGVAGGPGALYAFELDGATWKQQQRIADPTQQAEAHFGQTVARSGDWLAVGAPQYRVGAGRTGAVFLFRRTSAGWVAQGQLLAPAREARFGSQLVLTGNVLVVGSEGEVYAFERHGPNWQVVALESDGPSIAFGSFIASSGGRIALAQARYSSGIEIQLYERTAAGRWLRADTLFADPDRPFFPGWRFSGAVAMAGGSLTVAFEPVEHDGEAPYQVFSFVRHAGEWQERRPLSVEADSNPFAWGALAMSDGHVLVGSLFDSKGSALQTGNTYVFDHPYGDADDDGITDDNDEDNDNDGVPNIEDQAPFDKFQCGDLDRDQCDDCARNSNNQGSRPGDDGPDTDGDGSCDLGDDDDDNDQVPDGLDNCVRVANANQADHDRDGLGDRCDQDDDNDGVIDAADNCPADGNSAQTDSDRDGRGDACDDDRDGDGVADTADVCPQVPDATQTDSDRDGVGDACDPDADGDGLDQDVDNCPATVNTDQRDSDADGIGDVCDPDRDGDGVPNELDNCPAVPNDDQRDLDDDRIGDQCDPLADAPPTQRPRSNTGGCNAGAEGQGDAKSLVMILLLALTIRFRRRRRLWLFATVICASSLSVGCQSSIFARCGDLICPSGSTCTPDGSRCVSLESLDACRELPNGSLCSIGSRQQGRCQDDVCDPLSCGNGVVEGDEVCDDGNRLAGDGCSPDCLSREICGNAVVDVFAGEQCDCGVAGSSIPNRCSAANGPGSECSSNCQVLGCGDGIVSEGEDCEGATTVTCRDLGFSGGELACSLACRFDTAECEKCGNGNVDPGEACDGLPPVTDCVALGYDLGHLSCTSFCSADETTCESLDWKLVHGVVAEAGTSLWAGEDLAVVVGRAGLLYEYRLDDRGEIVDLPITTDLHDVDGRDDLVVAVGAQGVILERTDERWIQKDSPAANALNAVRVFPSGRAVAVGEGGVAIQRENDGKWKLADWHTDTDMFSVDGRGIDDLVVGGTDRSVWRVQENVVSSARGRFPMFGSRVTSIRYLNDGQLLATGDSTVVSMQRDDGWPTVLQDVQTRLSAVVGDETVVVARGKALVVGHDFTRLSSSSWPLAPVDDNLGSPVELAVLGNGEVLLLTTLGLFSQGDRRWLSSESPLALPANGAIGYHQSSAGTYLVYAPRNSRDLRLYRFDQHRWRWVDDIVSADRPVVRDVAGVDSGPSLLVGADGLILRRGANGWVREANGLTSEDFNSVFALDDKTAYAVGNGGTVAAYGPDGWRLLPIPTTANLLAVWARGREIFVGAEGEDATLLYFDGTNWWPIHLGDPAGNVSDIWGNEHEVIAVGSGGNALHFDGTVWQTQPTPVDEQLLSVHGIGRDAYATGPTAGVLHWNGTRWARVNGATGRLISTTHDAVFVDGAVLWRGPMW